MANAGYDLCETRVLSNLHNEKTKEIGTEIGEKHIRGYHSEDQKVSSHSLFCWKFKKVSSNSSKPLVGSIEKLGTLELK